MAVATVPLHHYTTYSDAARLMRGVGGSVAWRSQDFLRVQQLEGKDQRLAPVIAEMWK